MATIDMSQRSGGSSGGSAVTSFVRETSGNRLILAIFIICIFLPISKEVGGLRLNPTRIFLLIATVPFAIQCLAGKFGRVTGVDILMVIHSIWIFLSLVANHGGSVVPFAGITTVELAGGYFVGRAIVRSSDDYRFVFKFILVILILLAPLTLLENLTQEMVIPDLVRPFFDTHTRDHSARGRLGLERVQSVFDHPILWGMFCSITISNFMKCLRGPLIWRLLFIALSVWCTFTSLSSGPLLAIGLQTALLLWGWVTRDRWLLIVILAAIAYISIDLLSNRGPIKLLISYATFNTMSAYTRIIQFEWGIRNIQDNMLFGIGLNEWVRVSWVTGQSVDNFWLVAGMRYGVIAVFSILGAFFLHIFLGAYAVISDAEIRRIRIGHMIALVALIFVMVTVHLWGNTSIFVMFYLGSGAWIYTNALNLGPQDDDAPATDTPPPSPDSRRSGGPVYSRFATLKTRGDMQNLETGRSDRRSEETRRRDAAADPVRPDIATAARRQTPDNLWARDFTKDRPPSR